MANAMFNAKWQEAMSELNEQLHLEDHTLGLREGETAGAPTQAASVSEALQHWSCLYVKYLSIARSLESCYDGVVHPQKRVDIKLVLELVLSRVLELKAMLVKWQPAHPSLVAPGAEGPLPWEYVNLDDVLVDLKLPPKVLEVPVPRYFLEENADAQAARDKLVSALAVVKLGEERGGAGALRLERGRRARERAAPFVEMTAEEAVDCLQRAERGRQGMLRAAAAAAAAAEDRAGGPAGPGAAPSPLPSPMGSKSKQQQQQLRLLQQHQAALELAQDPEIAAGNIQRLYRGATARREVAEARDRELEFIGMRSESQWAGAAGGAAGGRRGGEARTQQQLAAARARRKAEQRENEAGYSSALMELHGTVLEEEGPDMREKMMDERRAWFTEELGRGVFPEDLAGFYLAKNPPPPEDAASQAGKGGKGGKKDDKKGGAKKDDKAGKDKKGKKGDEEVVEEKLPPLTGPTLFSRTVAQLLARYNEVWADRDESGNYAQRHDAELARAVVRPNVAEEVREHVDKMLVLQLQNLRSQLEAAASGGKKKKGKKDKKGKKGKKGKGKKEKKAKPLPGEKLCAGMDLEEMLAELVALGVAAEADPVARLDSLVGDFNYLGTAYRQHSELRNKAGEWEPQDPSLSQVRNAVAEAVVLPLGCPLLRVTAPYAKSLLLYGPAGCGKTAMAQAVAAQTHALLLNVSPDVLEALPKEYKEGKAGPTKFLHMVFSVARHPSFAPCVLYLDRCEQVFAGKKKGGEPAKFKKDLITYCNSLKPEERVAVVGCATAPFEIPDGELKDLRAVFQRFLYMPYPDYASRATLWRHFLERAFGAIKQDVPEEIDCGSLALLSAGFSPGTIEDAVAKTLTARRLAHLKGAPVSDKDLAAQLSSMPCTYREDNAKFQAFTAAITGLQERRDKVKAISSGEGGDGKKDAKARKK
jgi:hypothetical protein